MASDSRISVGQLNFSGGVDSSKPASAASQVNPNGLKSNQVSWLSNGTVRGGAISNRPGEFHLASFALNIGILQEAKMYDPQGNAEYPSQPYSNFPLSGFPYIIAQIAGRTFIVRVDTDNSIVEVTIPSNPNPAGLTQSWMTQAEEFMIIQDGVSEPLIWNGVILQRVSTMFPGAPRISLIPAATCMSYWQGRLWLANGRQILGGDIVRGPSGTATYDKRDSVLRITESLYETTGGVIAVPSQAGNIRALDFTVNINTNLGQGDLYAFTRKSIYQINVPTTRAEWITQTQPVTKVASITWGTTSDRSIVKANGDLFFQTPLGVMSLSVAIRDFRKWGNTLVSKEENRVTRLNNRALLNFGCGIQFDNRCLQTVVPIQTAVGVAHLGLMPLDFDIIGTLSEELPPAWEGMWEGYDRLRVLEDDYGGLQRAFSIIHSRITGGIEVWEMSLQNLTDENDARITRVIEFPSMDGGKPFALKQLDCAEFWVDQISGTVDFTLEYREGQNPCWKPFAQWQRCFARNECEDIGMPQPCDYPQQPYSQGYFQSLTTPQAKAGACDPANKRPSNIAYSFQLRLTTRGANRLRGYVLHLLPRDTAPYEGIIC